MQSEQFFKYRLLILTTLIFIIAGNLFSQPPQRGRMQGPPPLPDSTQIVKMVDELATTLSLTKEQKSKILELHFAHFEEAKKLMEKNKSDRESHREAMDELKEEFDEQVKDVLTEDQVEAFKEYVENRKKQQRGSRPGRR